MGLYLRR
jgi:lysophospholipase L1-like esterase